MSGRAAAAMLVLGAGLLAGPASASAGTYVVNACGPSAQNTNHSWTLTNTLAGVVAGNGCGTADIYGGLYVRERVGGTPSPLTNNQAAGWTFTAPPGLTIAGITYKRWLYKNDDNLHAALTNANGAILEECGIAFPADACSVGGAGDASKSVPASGTTALTIGVSCRLVAPFVRCSAGGGIKPGFVASLDDAAVTVTDTGPPVTTAPSGGLYGGGWLRGVQSVSVGGSDASGVSRAVVLADGSEVARTDRPCDFTYAKPCSDAPAGTAVSVDTAKLADGQHMVQAGVVDAAGNRSVSAPVAVLVDNHAPQPPEGLHGPFGWQSAHQVAVGGSVPAGQASPVTMARYQVCDGDGGSCDAPQSASVSGGQFSVTPSVADGRHVVRVWLVDAASNQDPANSAIVAVDVDTGAPAPPTSAAVQVSGREATVSWKDPADSGSPLTGALVQLCPSSGSCLAVQKTSGGSLRTGQLATGRWTAKVWLVDEVGHQDAAHPATVEFTVPEPVVRVSPRLRATVTRARHHRLRISARLASSATGRLTVSIMLRDRRGHGMRSIRRRIAVKHGRARSTFTLPARARRARVTVRYAGSRRLLAQSRAVSVRGLR
mgnify:CR=1 FL=1